MPRRRMGINDWMMLLKQVKECRTARLVWGVLIYNLCMQRAC